MLAKSHWLRGVELPLGVADHGDLCGVHWGALSADRLSGPPSAGPALARGDRRCHHQVLGLPLQTVDLSTERPVVPPPGPYLDVVSTVLDKVRCC